MNPFKYLFLIGAILLGAIAMVSMLMSGQGAIWDWLPWFAFIPAYMLLNNVIEDYGLGSAYTLWAGGIVILVALFVVLYGESWGEVLTSGQYIALGVTVLGLLGLSLSQPNTK
ncbi:MAG: SMR family transporter [Candidatus Promineifilaceae bacterium]